MEEESISHINSHLARHPELVEGQTSDPVKVRDNSGLVREGYKKTKLGWIPEEWEIKSLDDIGDFSKGKGISKMEISSSGKPCIRYAEIYTKYDFYTEHLESYVSEESALNSREISYGDLLFAGSGETLEDIGKCVAYLGKEDAFAGGDIVILRPKKEHARYLGFLLNHSVANRQKYKLGQGHSVVHIYSSGLKKLKVPLPPIKEQQKIATILSTWDRAIAKQEQLINAKQEFKKGLMQLLLTGKKRFEGFEGEWKAKKLKDLGEVFTGGTPSSEVEDYWGGEITWYTPSEIRGAGKYIQKSRRKITLKGLKNSSATTFPKNTIVVCTRATIGELSISQVEASTNQGFKNLYVSKYNDVEFIYYKLKQSKTIFMRKASGSTFLELSTTDFRNLILKVPPLSEQQKIASVLSAADKEIELLQSELTQLQEQKRGLMQKLLTGQVRVKY